MDLTTTEPFSDTFGAKAQRKRPRLDVGSISELASKAASQQASTSAVTLDTPLDSITGGAEDTEQSRNPEEVAAEIENAALGNVPRDYILSAGTSRRIWGELYKVCLLLLVSPSSIDCSCRRSSIRRICFFMFSTLEILSVPDARVWKPISRRRSAGRRSSTSSTRSIWFRVG